MATLHFDGADDWVRGNTSGAWNGTFTIAALVRATNAFGPFDTIIGVHSATLMSWQLALFGTPNVIWYDDLNGHQHQPGTAFNDEDVNDWYIIVVTRASGATTPRFHFKNLTDGTAWEHVDSIAASAANPRSASGGYFKIGNFDNSPGTPGSADDDFEGDIGLVGFWDGVNMSDGEVEALLTNMKTSDWHNHAAGDVTLLTELTSTTPIDIGEAVISLTVTGATLTGSDPPGWTFDGGGFAVRGFDGVADSITVDDGGVGNTNQAFTFVALFQTDEAGGASRPIFGVGTTGTGVTMGRAGDSLGYYDNDEIAFPEVGLGITVDTWFVVAMSKGAGVDAPRFHAKPLGSGSWVHDTSATAVTPPSATADRITFGRYPDGADDFFGRIAVAALFTSELSDGVIESIESNPTTAFLASLSPFALWEFNQASVADDVLDLIGTADEVSVAGTHVVTDAGPGGWTFGLEAAAEKQSYYVRRRKAWR